MQISININAPAQGVSHNTETNPKTKGFVATNHLFNPAVRQDAARSLESRVQDLTAKLEELSPGEMDAEIEVCEAGLVGLLAKVRAVKFANAFPLVFELDENSGEIPDELKDKEGL